MRGVTHQERDSFQNALPFSILERCIFRFAKREITIVEFRLSVRSILCCDAAFLFAALFVERCRYFLSYVVPLFFIE